MWTENAQRIGITPEKLVAAVFLDETAARDAIADLKLAGFRAADIGVCTSCGGGHKDAHPGGKHSLRWKLRHSFQADLHKQGPGVPTSKGHEALAAQEEIPYTELDLREAMQALHMPEDTIKLVDEEVGPGGLLIFVAAGYERQREVESILERDRGILRTSMATQPAGKGSLGAAKAAH
jgi:hypothetical protein